MSAFTVGWFERVVGLALYLILAGFVMGTFGVVLAEHGEYTAEVASAIQILNAILLVGGVLVFLGRPLTVLGGTELVSKIEAVRE